MTPTGAPSISARPTTRLRAQRGPSSSISPASTSRAMTSRTSYTWRSRSGSTAPGSPAAGSRGGYSGSAPPALEGKCARAARTISAACTSPSATRCATPCLACTFGPPRSSAVMRSRVTFSTTAGPVRNMRASGPAMTVRSPSAGEYAAPPAHGPPITLICGTPAIACARKIREYACSAPTPSCRRAPPECGKPTTGTPSLSACSIVRAIVSPPRTPSEPPLNAPSCAQEHTTRPLTRPEPVRTPSPTSERVGRKLPGSKSSSRRARATRCSGATSNTALIARASSRGGRGPLSSDDALSCSPHGQACVLSAESEGVRQRQFEPWCLAGPLGHVIQIALRVGRLVVDRRRQYTATYRFDTHDRLDGTRSAEQVADVRLRRGHRGRRRRAVEHLLDRVGLDLVVERGRGAVGVDVAHVGR